MCVVRLDQHVNVIALDRELCDAEVAALARNSEAAAQGAHEGSLSQRRQFFAHAQRDVRGAIARDRLASHVVDDRPPPARAAGTRSRTAAPRAPAMVVEGDLGRAHLRLIAGYVSRSVMST
jgi:hypothetical protein